MKTLLVSAVLLIGTVVSCFGAPEEELIIYRWIDDNGVIHLVSEKPEWWTEEHTNAEDWTTIRPESEDDQEKQARTEGEEVSEPDSGLSESLSFNDATEAAGGFGSEAKSEPAEESEAAAEPEAENESTMPYIGNQRTKVYHHNDCRLIYRKNRADKFVIPKSLRIFFSSSEEAESRGYKACQFCKP